MTKIAVAFDFDDLDEALRLARLVAPHVQVAKVGLELFAAAGPRAIAAFRALGFEVFCDLKLHDIPTTVGKAARVLGGLGVSYATIHTAGGLAMVRAGVDGFDDGAAAAGFARPVALGVTILTSDLDAPPELFDERLATARSAGCGGVVCSPLEITRVRAVDGAIVIVTPGIRPAGAALDDQARVATPAMAKARGADIVVIGRPITGADDPTASAAAIAAELGLDG